jgi:hypothetical protein
LNTDGENILKLVQQVRQLCQQTALLLRTADEQMKKKCWISNNTAFAEKSGSILYPEYWIPIMAFQYYSNDKHLNRLVYVSVLLDNDWTEKFTIKEPLITAGFFDYGTEEFNGNWDYKYFRYFGHLSRTHDLKPDGQHFHFDRKMVPISLIGKFKNTFETGVVFALPLTSITNASEVESKITNILLDLLDKQD